MIHMITAEASILSFSMICAIFLALAGTGQGCHMDIADRQGSTGASAPARGWGRHFRDRSFASGGQIQTSAGAGD